MGLDVGQDFDGLCTTIFLGEPTGTSWKKRNPNHEDHAWYELDAPRSAERSWAGDERTTVPDEEHDEDAPFDGELLDDDDGAAFVVSGDLGEVYGNLRGCDAHADTVEYATTDEHAPASAGDLDGSAC